MKQNELDKIVLDFDTKTKEEFLSVDGSIVKHLKPHQVKGVKFMWDACFETVEKAKNSIGGGCILAHCMGLGKTLQVVTLAHTVLMNEMETGVRKVLIICPVSTVLNWLNEFQKWFEDYEDERDYEVYEMTK